jgi:integrase
VFISTTGTPLLPYSVTHGFNGIVKKLGLDDARFHDLRYTHATVMLLRGVHPKVAQERIGPSKMSTTMDIYSHVVPSMQKEAVKRFAMALETSK